MKELMLQQEIEQLRKEVAEIRAKRDSRARVKRYFSKMNVLIGVGITIVFSSLFLYAAQTVFVDGTVISAEEVNANFTELYEKVNPAYDTGWVDVDASINNFQTFTHDFNSIPSKVSLYLSPDRGANVQLVGFDSTAVNRSPETVWMTDTTITVMFYSSDYLINCSTNHPCPDGITTTDSGYMRVLLWK